MLNKDIGLMGLAFRQKSNNNNFGKMGNLTVNVTKIV